MYLISPLYGTKMLCTEDVLVPAFSLVYLLSAYKVYVFHQDSLRLQFKVVLPYHMLTTLTGARLNKPGNKALV